MTQPRERRRPALRLYEQLTTRPACSNLLDKAILAHSRPRRRVAAAARSTRSPSTSRAAACRSSIDYEGDHVLICKGAVEEIFSVCSRYQVDERDPPAHRAILKTTCCEEYESLNADGFRVLAIAYREYPQSKAVFSVADETDLILLGYIAFFDPPKESAPTAAIEALRKYGRRDQDPHRRQRAGHAKDLQRRRPGSTAHRAPGTSCELSTTPSWPRSPKRPRCSPGCRPRKRSRSSARCSASGHVVGFMGDGINDVAAMKAADVGISVDTAVDVAKESADIILLEKACSSSRTASSKAARSSATSSSTSRWARARTSATCSAWWAPASSCRSCRWRRSRC